MGCTNGRVGEPQDVQEGYVGKLPTTQHHAHVTDVMRHPLVSLVEKGGTQYYALKQSFAIVRHGDRLDNDFAGWDKYPLRHKYPNDTPLTELGHKHATETGQALKATGTEFGLIISSPYLRCAQTASRIAQVLGLCVHFDQDMGEVFDEISMGAKNLAGQPQFRSKEVLAEELKKDFPTVGYVTDHEDRLLIEGKLPRFPEDFGAARMRFCYRTKKLLQKAASELMSVVIVTHGDAVGAVVGMLREDWAIKDVPFTAYAHCTRQVKVLEKGGTEILREEPVYEDCDSWKLQLSPGVKHDMVKNHFKAHLQHERDVRLMGIVGQNMKSTYELTDDHVSILSGALDAMNASDRDKAVLLNKMVSSHHLNDKESRLQCKKPAAGGAANKV